MLNKAPALTIDGIIFHNQTPQTIYDVGLYVEKTKAFAHCSHVYSGKECSSTFLVKRYQGNQVRVTWEQNGKDWSTSNFLVTTPKELTPGKPATVRVVVTGNGTAKAVFVQ